MSIIAYAVQVRIQHLKLSTSINWGEMRAKPAFEGEHIQSTLDIFTISLNSLQESFIEPC